MLVCEQVIAVAWIFWYRLNSRINLNYSWSKQNWPHAKRHFHFSGDHNAFSNVLVIIRHFHLPGDHNAISSVLVIIRHFHSPGDHTASPTGLVIISQFNLPKHFAGPANNWSCGAYSWCRSDNRLNRLRIGFCGGIGNTICNGSSSVLLEVFLV